MMYTALTDGELPISLPGAGSYDQFYERRHTCLSTLTMQSPEIRARVDQLRREQQGRSSGPTFPWRIDHRRRHRRREVTDVFALLMRANAATVAVWMASSSLASLPRG
jgi:hypothetical protein